MSGDHWEARLTRIAPLRGDLQHEVRLMDHGFLRSGTSYQASPQLSVVAPCYNEAESLNEFWRRTSVACQHCVADAHEIVLVDDGSKDDTWRIIETLSACDAHVVGIRLMRNHG